VWSVPVLSNQLNPRGFKQTQDRDQETNSERLDKDSSSREEEPAEAAMKTIDSMRSDVHEWFKKHSAVKRTIRHRESIAAHAFKKIIVNEVCIVKYVQM
jgi:hypothetical protein